MNKLNRSIENHYFLKQGLFNDIVQRLNDLGLDLNNITRQDIKGVDEFHVRGAAVSKELASSIDLRKAKVLDIGCGLGGPCRMLAEEYNCHCTGIDLSHEFVQTAIKLSDLVKLSEKTSFVQGDALNLPFENESFDVVWTQHVQMNVPDKNRFYAEMNRVLKPQGHFLYYDVFRGNNGDVIYPMPWASEVGHSFLFKAEEMAFILDQFDFIKVESRDQTADGIAFFERMKQNIEKHGPPKLGLNIIMGESTLPKLMNLMNHFKDGRLILQSGVYRKG